MVKYKVNLKFKEDGKSLNEVLTKVLKIELEKRIKNTCKNSNLELSFMHTHYSPKKGVVINGRE